MSNKIPFQEGFSDCKHADPLAKWVSDFEWNQLYERLGEATTEPADMEAASLAMLRIIEWIVGKKAARMTFSLGYEQRMANKILALLWVLNPGYFESTPSLAMLSKKMGLKQRVTLSGYAAEVTRKFGVRNRGQSHGWNFKQLKEGKTEHEHTP